MQSGLSITGRTLNILTLQEFESLKIQMISPKLILFQQKRFRLGPIFAKRCTDAVLDFCRIAQADCMVVDHKSYFSIWLHDHKKPNKPKTQPTPPPEVIDAEFIEYCQTALVDLIGPIGKLLIQQTLQTPDGRKPFTFIDTLSRLIPDPAKAQCFRSQFIPDQPQ